MAITITFTGERSGLTPGWSAMEEPLKEDGHTTEPLLEEEETGCHLKKAGSGCMGAVGARCMSIVGAGTGKRVGATGLT